MARLFQGKATGWDYGRMEGRLGFVWVTSWAAAVAAKLGRSWYVRIYFAQLIILSSLPCFRSLSIHMYIQVESYPVAVFRPLVLQDKYMEYELRHAHFRLWSRAS